MFEHGTNNCLIKLKGVKRQIFIGYYWLWSFAILPLVVTVQTIVHSQAFDCIYLFFFVTESSQRRRFDCFWFVFLLALGGQERVSALILFLCSRCLISCGHVTVKSERAM